MNKPIRVLHVLGGLGLGGAETFVMNLYRNIDRNEFQFDFVIYDDGLRDYEKEIEQLGGRIFYSPHFSVGKSLRYCIWWNAFLNKHPEYKIIHGHVRSTAVIYLGQAKIKKRHTIAHSHSTSSGKGVSALVKNIMQYPIRWIADQFFGCSVAANEWLFGKKIAHSSCCRVIKNGVDVQRFLFQQEYRSQIRAEFRLQEGTLVIGNIGRLVKAKNQFFLLDIFAELLQKKNDAVLLIVGTGLLEEKLKAHAKKLGVINHVQFLGNRMDVNKILSGMDIFVFPSLYEGLGIVAVEAQISGLNVICSDALPKEAFITDNIFVEKLSSTSKQWCDTILRVVEEENISCRTITDEIKAYDIHCIANDIQRFYWSVECLDKR